MDTQDFVDEVDASIHTSKEESDQITSQISVVTENLENSIQPHVIQDDTHTAEEHSNEFSKDFIKDSCSPDDTSEVSTDSIPSLEKVEPLVKAEESKKQAEIETQLKAKEEAKKQADLEAQLKAEEEAKLKAEEEAKKQAEFEAQLKAEEEAKLMAEDEAKKQAEIEAQLKAEIEAAQEKAAIEAEPIPEVDPVEEETPVTLPINETTPESNDSSDSEASEPEIKIIEKIENNLKEELDKNIPDLKIPDMDNLISTTN